MRLRSDEETIQRVLDGNLDDRAFEKFQDRMRVEPELRTLYLSYSRSHGLLEEKFGASDRVVVPMRPRPRKRWLPVAAAACGMLLAVVAVVFRGESETIDLVFGPESHGQVVGGGSRGEFGVGSRIEMDHGSLSMKLPSGRRAFFEGPGELVRTGPEAFKLVEGRIWFQGSDSRDGLECETDRLRVIGGTGEFGLIAEAGRPQQLQVLRGEVGLEAGDEAREMVAAGRCVVWEKDSVTERDRALAFSASFPHAVTVFSDDLDDGDYTPLAGKLPDVGQGAWEVVAGGPVILGGVLDTSGNARHIAFAPLSELPLDELSHVLLMTLETETPGASGEDSLGWAGVSLYTGDEERIFVGDPCGPEKGWALHPVGYEARNSCPLLRGKSTVTLRYDFRSGLVQLFEGRDTSGVALASEWIAPGLSFDRIRIANGSRADAAADAGKSRSAAGNGPGVNTRSNIALRRISVSVLCAKEERRVGRF